MDVKEMSMVMEATMTTKNVTTATITTTMTKPTAVITQIASKECLKILELTEYCKRAQSTLIEFETKIQALISAKNEAVRLKTEYLTRDKTNITNSESLLQAKNELFQYKCELKSNYVAIEKAVKAKKLQYAKILSSYEADWQKALVEYTTNPLVTELNDIQRTSTDLEKIIETQEKLNASTRIQMSELNRNAKEKFFNKILEFSKVMMQYRKFLDARKIDREENVDQAMPQGNEHLKFPKYVVPAFSKTVSSNKEDPSCFPGIDVSVFDDMMVPMENLEIQNEEEEMFHFIQNEKEQLGDKSATQEESPEKITTDYHPSEDQDKNKSQINAEDIGKQNLEKVTEEEDESQYFRTQAGECSNQHSVQNATTENWDHVTENEYGSKEFNENSFHSKENEGINREDNIEIGKQMESEKSFGEASSDNQNNYTRDNFEYSYNKTHSVSSEDIHLSAEITNESFGSPRKMLITEQSNIFKLQDNPEREEPKSFGDFFVMSSDKNPARPSIFQLF